MSKADEIMDVLIDTLEQSGYKIEDVHLINYDTWKGIENDMERALRSKGLDLSYTSDYSEKYDVKLSGNAGGIISGFRYFYKKHPQYGWHEAKINGSDIESAKEFYENDRYGYATKISKERFINLVSTEKGGSQHIGIGSQASINVTTVTVYADNQNNLMFDKTTLVYD